MAHPPNNDNLQTYKSKRKRKLTVLDNLNFNIKLFTLIFKFSCCRWRWWR